GYFQCNVVSLRMPLLALIDYRGHRLTAMTMLPIDNSTLKYGSENHGNTVFNSDPELNAKMQAVARALNIKTLYLYFIFIFFFFFFFFLCIFIIFFWCDLL